MLLRGTLLFPKTIGTVVFKQKFRLKKLSWISRGLQCQLINKQQKRPISWFLLKPVRSCLKETRWMPGSLKKPAAALLPMKEKLTKRIGKLPILIRSEEHTSELQSLMRISYADFCLKKQNKKITIT